MENHGRRTTPRVLDLPKVVVEERVAHDVDIGECFAMTKPRVQVQQHVDCRSEPDRDCRALDVAHADNVRLEHRNQEQDHRGRVSVLEVTRLDCVRSVR